MFSLEDLLRALNDPKIILQVWYQNKRVYHGNACDIGEYMIREERKATRVYCMDIDNGELSFKVGSFL